MNKFSFDDKKIAILGFGMEWKSTLQFLLDHGVDFSYITIIDEVNHIDNATEYREVLDDFFKNAEIA